MKLYIDSTDNKRTILRIGDKEFTKEVASPREQDVFGFLVKTLKELNLSPRDISEVEVNPGPGSFTGSRVGVTIANALGFSLKIPVNGQNSPIDVIYSSPPSITHKKL